MPKIQGAGTIEDAEPSLTPTSESSDAGAPAEDVVVDEAGMMGSIVLIQATVRRRVVRRATKKALSERPKSYTASGAREIMDLFIEPNVSLELRCQTTGLRSTDRDSDRDGAGGTYEVIGPSRVTDALRRAFGRGQGTIRGVISPANEVTLPPAIKREAGIPLAATHFAYVYPLKEFKDNNHSVNVAEEPWAFALLIGGFAYFGSDGELLAVNALTIVPSPAVLHLVGPYPPRHQAMVAMARLGRVSETTIDGLRDAGFRRFGWVHPGEAPGGFLISDKVKCAHGGFVYEMAGGDQALFVLTGGAPLERDVFDHDGRFGHAYVMLRQVLVDAVEDLNATKEAKSNRVQLGYETVYLVIALSIYYGIACVFFMNDAEWSALESIYFATVTASTVGYGDLSPSRTISARVFTVFLIILGVFVVGTRLTTVMSCLTRYYERALEKRLTYKGVDSDGKPVVQRAWIYYPKHLLPLFILNLIVQLGFAAVFNLVEEWSFASALYHCVVTCTTVGYGDVPIVTSNGQIVAICHILLSTALLGNTISSADRLRVSRTKEQLRVIALNQKLTQPLLQRVELHAASLRPEVQRDASGVTELEFVICMAVELGMVDMKQLKPFVEQFRALDVVGNGRLGMEDLNAAEKLRRTMELLKSDGGGLGQLTSFMSEKHSNQKHTKSNRLWIESRGSPRGKKDKQVKRQRSLNWQFAADHVATGEVQKLRVTMAPQRRPRSGWKLVGMATAMKSTTRNLLESDADARSAVWSGVLPSSHESKAVVIGGPAETESFHRDMWQKAVSSLDPGEVKAAPLLVVARMLAATQNATSASTDVDAVEEFHQDADVELGERAGDGERTRTGFE